MASNTAARHSLEARTAAHRSFNDDLDELFHDSDHVNVADAFQEVNTDMGPVHTAADGGAGAMTRKRAGDDLGIDETIKVRKARVTVRLDEERLLSEPGIPKLRRIAKERLRFKGKGHEFSDVARLLALYQLWLDDLYPKAKFADALAMVEKLGHSRRMQTMRREWVEEGKQRDTLPEMEESPAGVHDDAAGINLPLRQGATRPPVGGLEMDLSSPPAGTRLQTPPTTSEDDLYSATPRALQQRRGAPFEALASAGHPNGDLPPEEQATGTGERLAQASNTHGGTHADDLSEDDDLDVWLAEDAAKRAGVGPDHPTASAAAATATAPATAPPARMLEDDFDDDLEAMMEMEGM
ncbi:MAG: chromosome segregation in meiosis- protein [Phylliscum demangeonii]|nr:MAG: chromosome segregation in meiosis- protein [Phylliscum demangeonii]